MCTRNDTKPLFQYNNVQQEWGFFCLISPSARSLPASSSSSSSPGDVACRADPDQCVSSAGGFKLNVSGFKLNVSGFKLN
eukprot:492134-Rhodomonas_salina.3